MNVFWCRQQREGCDQCVSVCVGRTHWMYVRSTDGGRVRLCVRQHCSADRWMHWPRLSQQHRPSRLRLYGALERTFLPTAKNRNGERRRKRKLRRRTNTNTHTVCVCVCFSSITTSTAGRLQFAAVSVTASSRYTIHNAALINKQMWLHQTLVLGKKKSMKIHVNVKVSALISPCSDLYEMLFSRRFSVLRLLCSCLSLFLILSFCILYQTQLCCRGGNMDYK